MPSLWAAIVGLLLLAGAIALWALWRYLRAQTAAARALRQTEERLSLVLSSVEAGVWEWDVRSNSVIWSEGMYRLFGLAPEIFTPSVENGAAAVHPDDREAVQQLIRDTLATKKTEYRIEHRVAHPELDGRWIMGIGRVVYDQNGQPQRMSGLSVDITQRKITEEALRKSEQRYRGLVEFQNDMVLRFDADGRYTFVNGNACRVFGRPREELLGSHWADVVHPDDIEETASAIERAIAGPEHRATAECRIQTVAGLRWYLWEGAPVFGRDGRLIELQAVGRDVTDRRRMEENLRIAKDEAERANASKSKFLAAASHDLRQPMQSLFLFSGALKELVRNEEALSALAKLDRGLETLKELLDCLLDVSRLDAGAIQTQIEDFPLGVLLEEVEATYASAARRKGLEFQIDQDCADITVHSDQLLLGRMLRNLVGNAIRYTNSGFVHVMCRSTQNGLCLEVRDSGIGIPPDQMEQIFEEFHQVGNPERDRTQGLGLGLAIVKRLSVLLEHPVHVQSELCNGSIFSIQVPRGGTSDIYCPVAEAAIGSRRHGQFAVLVDDDASVLTGLQMLLQTWGYEVLTAASTSQALERLATTGKVPVVVVADFRLREGQVGTDTVMQIRAQLGRPVPGIILTGELGGEWQAGAKVNGLEVVFKPVTPRQLYDALEQCIRSNAL